LSRDKTNPPLTERGENGVLYEDCPARNRVQLFFRGKPDSAIRDRLKSNGIPVDTIPPMLAGAPQFPVARRGQVFVRPEEPAAN
jgi:hypothetical protein